jgi:hypothetical protein
MEAKNLDKEDTLDALYAERAKAIDPERTWNIRESAWQEIDQLLDRFNELLKAEVEVEI